MKERNGRGRILKEGGRERMVVMERIDIWRYVKKGENIIGVWYGGGRIRNKRKEVWLEVDGWYRECVCFYDKGEERWWWKGVKGGS